MMSRRKMADEISLILPSISRKLYSDLMVEMSSSQIFLILFVDECRSCRISDVAKELNVSAPTASGLVDRLSRAGYLKRTRDTDDRRVTNVVLTAKGKNMAKHLRTSCRDRWEKVLKHLPEKDAATYVRIIRKIYDNMNAEDGSCVI